MAEPPAPMIEYAPCGLVWAKPGAAFETVLMVPEVVQPAVVLCRAELPVEAGVVVESPLAAMVFAQANATGFPVRSANMLTVFNAVTLGAAEYSLSWTDVATTEQILYGLSADGIEQLSGALSTAPQVVTGQLQPAGGQEFNLPRLTLGAAGTTCTVGVTAKMQGQSQTVGSFDVELSGELDQHELMVGAGQHARAYQLTVEGTDGLEVRTLDGWINTVRHRRA